MTCVRLFTAGIMLAHAVSGKRPLEQVDTAGSLVEEGFEVIDRSKQHLYSYMELRESDEKENEKEEKRSHVTRGGGPFSKKKKESPFGENGGGGGDDGVTEKRNGNDIKHDVKQNSRFGVGASLGTAVSFISPGIGACAVSFIHMGAIAEHLGEDDYPFYPRGCGVGEGEGGSGGLLAGVMGR